MIRKIRLVTIIFTLCISCITYTRRLVTPKGARLKTDCGYEESNNFYNVIAIYVKNAKIKPFLYKLRSDDEKNKHDYMEFYLVKGEHTILLLMGIAEPLKIGHVHDIFGLFTGLDSIILRDTLFLESDNTGSIFYFDRHHAGFHQTGYTQELDGYLLIESVAADTVSGIVNFTAQTKGYYSSYRARQSIRDTIGSWVGCDIQFKATLEPVKVDSIPIGRVWLDFRLNTESED